MDPCWRELPLELKTEILSWVPLWKTSRLCWRCRRCSDVVLKQWGYIRTCYIDCGRRHMYYMVRCLQCRYGLHFLEECELVAPVFALRSPSLKHGSHLVNHACSHVGRKHITNCGARAAMQ
jgi:hypothetical protein